MTQLFAQPYDISATGFFFETAEEYNQKAKSLRNSYGLPVEEFEIQFIDGKGIDAELFESLGVHQGDLAAFFEAVDSWNEEEKVKAIIALSEVGYDFNLGKQEPKIALWVIEKEKAGALGGASGLFWLNFKL